MSTSGLVLPPLDLPPGLPLGPGTPTTFDAGSTIGALLIGGLVSAILFGITSTQSWVYFQTDHGDRWQLRAVVSALWALDTFDMCLIFHILYWYLITHYGDSRALSNPVWSIIIHVLVTSLTETVVRCMFALRIWRLSQNVILVVVVLAITLTDLIACIMITAEAFYNTFDTLHRLDACTLLLFQLISPSLLFFYVHQALFYLNFSAGLAGDSLVAISLCWILHQSRIGFGETEKAITWLMTYIINTGLFTAIVASIGLILFAVQPGNFIYIAVYLQLSKLYTNAYLAMLNSRISLRSQSSVSDLITLDGIQLSSSLSATQVHSGQDNLAALHRMHSLTKGGGLDIVVHTEVDMRSDSKYDRRQSRKTIDV